MNTETLLGPYEVSGFFSEAGLDDLYLGIDTRDGGEVAIRALPVFFDEDAVIRRLRERARNIASLNEPGLLFVTEVSKADGAVLAVVPRPRAKALDRHIPADGLLPGDVFGVSLGLVTAIDALQRGGFLHGYLHPGRVLVTNDHDVRVLAIGPEDAEAPSVRVAACRPPESWSGEEVDACGEVFSLGVLLHQAATGELPFEGETVEELGRSIQEDIPHAVTDIRPDLPRELAVIIARCLKKNRAHRYQSAAEILAELEGLKEAIVEGKVTVGRQTEQQAESAAPAEEQAPKVPWSDRLPEMPAGWGVVALAGAGLLVAFLLGLFWGGAGPAEATRAPAALESATFYPGQELFPSLTADGSEMIFARSDGVDWDLFALRDGEVFPTELTADSAAADYQPALSPDGTRVAFRSERDGGGVFLMDRSSGAVRKLDELGFNPSWSPDGTQVAVADASVFDSPNLATSESNIWAVNVDSGARRQLTPGNGLQPSWSPDGGQVAYWWPRAGGGADIWTMPADGGEPVNVTDDAATDWNPVWSPDGRYLYFSSDRSGSLDIWRVGMDEGSGTPQGVAEPVTASGSVNGVHPAFASASGEMAYVEAASVRRLYRVPLDAGSGSVTGPPEPLPGSPRNAASPHVSAGSERITFVLTQGKQQDVYVAGPDGGGAAPVTRDKARDLHPRLAPDGRRVAFLSQRDGFYQLFTAEPDGRSPRQLTELKASHVSAPVWSRDGSRITVTIGTNMTPSYTLVFSADSDSEQVAETLHTSPSAETFEPNSWSRGGSRLAGDIRHGSGRRAGIAMLSVDTGEYEQLTDFGMHPVWLRDGRRLLFQWGARIYLLDTRSPEPREVFNSGSDILAEGFSLSGDDRWIYVSLERREADVWRMR